MQTSTEYSCPHTPHTSRTDLESASEDESEPITMRQPSDKQSPDSVDDQVTDLLTALSDCIGWLIFWL